MATIEEVREITTPGSDPFPRVLDESEFEEWLNKCHKAIADAVHYLGFDKISGTADTVIATWIMEHRNGGCHPLNDLLFDMFWEGIS